MDVYTKCYDRFWELYRKWSDDCLSPEEVDEMHECKEKLSEILEVY